MNNSFVWVVWFSFIADSFESITIFRIKINWNCNFVGLLHHPLWLQLVLALSDHLFQLLNFFVWSRITDDGSLPEMRIWSILFIKSDLKWCIHLSRNLFLYLLLSAPRIMRMELSFTTYISIRVKKESQSCTYINVKHGGLVIMDIKYMFKTYEAFL